MKLNPGKLRMLIYEHKLTQTSLASKAGVSRMTINNICCGSSCSTKTSQKVASALGVTVNEIMQQ